MRDTNDSNEQEQDSTEDSNNLTIDDVKEYSSNIEVIKFMQGKFSQITKKGAMNAINDLFKRKAKIHVSDIMSKWKRLYQYNKNKFDDEKFLRQDIISDLRRAMNGFLLEIGKDIPQYDAAEDLGFEIREENGEQTYIVNKMIMYRKVRGLTCDEGGNTNFKYNFVDPDMKIGFPANKEMLQRCEIQITSNAVKFDYPIEFEYTCPRCGNVIKKKAYETASTGGKIMCEGMYLAMTPSGEEKPKVCNTKLMPDNEISLTKDAFYYDINYEDIEGKKHTVSSISFNKYKPGFYESVLFKVKNPKKTEVYHIMDVKKIDSNRFDFPEQDPNENYVFTLQKAFDEYIKLKTGMEIYGLYPIKVSMILQKAITELGMRLIGNIQICGDASTGKSTVFKYYGFFLNNHLNMSTNGQSISIASLRGTREVVSLMGKDQKIVTTGYLGTYKTIHIDETGDNKELVQSLKTFLLEDNYSYDKAGSTGISHIKTALANLTENLSYQHLSFYRGSIKKAYREMTTKIGDEEKEDWDDDWDLHLSLSEYDWNPYLYDVIKNKRLEFQHNRIHWFSGYEWALSERFPFLFFLTNEKDNDYLDKVVKGNVSRGTIRENLELMRVLKSDDIDIFFEGLKKFKEGSNDRKSFEIVDDILESYGVYTDVRTKEFYYLIVQLSRILNKRKEIIEQDYDLLRWLLEKINCKLDVADTVDHNVVGPPDLKKTKEIEKKIEETSRLDDFGIPDGEFK